MKFIYKYRFFFLIITGTILLYFDYGNLSAVFFVLGVVSIWRYYIDNNEKWKKKE
tara:strand:+ start:291 stop:455 length:165 start_codon:yes stop_codon:yes gene_type:complete